MRVLYTATGYPTKYRVLEILSYILYHIELSDSSNYGLLGGNITSVEFSNPNILEYSCDYTRVPTGYPTFFMAYLIYSTSGKGTTKYPTPQKSIFQVTEACETCYYC